MRKLQTRENKTFSREETARKPCNQTERFIISLQIPFSFHKCNMQVCVCVCACVCVCVSMTMLNDNSGLCLWLDYTHKGSQAVSQMTKHYAQSQGIKIQMIIIINNNYELPFIKYSMM